MLVKFFLAVGLVVLGFFSVALGQHVDPHPNSRFTQAQISATLKRGQAIPIGVSADEAIPVSELNKNLQILSFVAQNPPESVKDNNLFNWTQGSGLVRRKQVSIRMMNSTSAEAQKLVEGFRRSAGGVSDETDAFTVTSLNRTTGALDIQVILLVDKMKENVKRVPGTTYSAKFATILAHEIYGNVQTFLNMDPSNPPTPSLATRQENERRAFRAGIDFIDGVVEKLGTDGKILPRRFMSGLIAQRKFEEAGLATWQKPAAPSGAINRPTKPPTSVR